MYQDCWKSFLVSLQESWCCYTCKVHTRAVRTAVSATTASHPYTSPDTHVQHFAIAIATVIPMGGSHPGKWQRGSVTESVPETRHPAPSLVLLLFSPSLRSSVLKKKSHLPKKGGIALVVKSMGFGDNSRSQALSCHIPGMWLWTSNPSAPHSVLPSAQWSSGSCCHDTPVSSFPPLPSAQKAHFSSPCTWTAPRDQLWKWSVSRGRLVASRCGQWGVHAHTVLCALSVPSPVTLHRLTDRSSSLPQAPSCDDQMKRQRKFLTQRLAQSPMNKWRPPSIDLHRWKGRPKIQSQDTYSTVHLFSLQMFAEYHAPSTLLGVEYTPRKYAHL